MAAKKLSDAQRDLLGRFDRATRQGRAVPFFTSTELDGTQKRTMWALEKAGLVEYRPGVEDNGETIKAWWLTPAGVAAVSGLGAGE